MSVDELADWHNWAILPYFDLVAISKIEGTRMPLHVIAGCLFPDETNVDVVERVRKVTKRKANAIFRWEVTEALRLQAGAHRRMASE